MSQQKSTEPRRGRRKATGRDQRAANQAAPAPHPRRAGAANPAGLEPMLTVEDVAALLRLSTRQVRRMLSDKSIPSVKFGRAVRIRPADVRKIMGE